MIVDVVILSNCNHQDYFNVNTECIRSLIASENNFSFNIFVIESNSNFNKLGFTYQFPNVRVIIPNEPFNFNLFLNIGLSETTNQWILLSNNDVRFHRDWLHEILKIKKQHAHIQSFCPFDRNSPYLSWEKYSKKTHHVGYRVPIEFVGWCSLMERTVFDKIGKLDEQFDLYFQDNDFALTLKKHGIVHAMVPHSFVEHIGGYTTKNHDASGTSKYAYDKAKLLKKWGKPSRINKLLSYIKRMAYVWTKMR
jgi:GT2 family glycosyltransferase